MSSNRSTFQSSSFSYASSTFNGQTRSQTQTTQSDPSGTTVHRTSQEPGQGRHEERLEYDNAGRRIEEADTKGRIEDVTDKEQSEKDREYEERIEDEYAKREGGA
ncbi:hypothetical protein P280DRAFT_467685 [Massarina eburnea CBS 473.64]|uniref:Uncharacterized protein n=1 Tax=Massarina eburnea CBS 473.64 TaxID=1395130 RepID=A0A6A6S797_9PLEO|nr:hypothetical protein P280DRAFT_467685 [Massarina eburnea CBS 473.64]